MMKLAFFLILAVFALFVAPEANWAQGYSCVTRHSFTGKGGDGASPLAGLTADGAGHWWGTTASGGANGLGTVFAIDAAIDATGEKPTAKTTAKTAWSFSGADGAGPQSALAFDGGILWGTTKNGGANGAGTVFGLLPLTGAVQTLCSLGGPNGSSPEAGVAADGQGHLVGTCYAGGPGGAGTVFAASEATGAISAVYAFSGPDGAGPTDSVLLDGAGNALGTTSSGGAGMKGTVFQVRPAQGPGASPTLWAFAGLDGAGPLGGLARDGAGNLWGTTARGGASNTGTIYEIARGSAALTPVYSFGKTDKEGRSPDGANPYGGLVVDGAGNLFGTTSGGGTPGRGTVFEIPAAALASGTAIPRILHSFTGVGKDGATPQAGVAVDAGGNLWGTTAFGGGPDDKGTVFELVVAAPIARTFLSPGGLDEGACRRSAPCRTLQYALSETSPGGTVTALKAGEYGPASITQAVTVDGEDAPVGITVPRSVDPASSEAGSVNGLTIDAAPTDLIVLRGLVLNGLGHGANGIECDGGCVRLEDCRVSGFSGDDIALLGPGKTALVQNATLTGGAAGLVIGSRAGVSGPSRVCVQNVIIVGAKTGVQASHGQTDISDGQILRGATALLASDGGTLTASGCALLGCGQASSEKAGGVVRVSP